MTLRQHEIKAEDCDEDGEEPEGGPAVHAQPRAAEAFNPLQVILIPNLDRLRLVDALVPGEKWESIEWPLTRP